MPLPEAEFQACVQRIKATETWQYLCNLAGDDELRIPGITWELVNTLEQPRKRDLPPAWRNRLAVDELTHGLKQLLIGYLTGDEVPGSNYCDLVANNNTNCRRMFRVAGPGSLNILKAGAFPRCVLNRDHSGRTKCCNQVYRSMQAVPAVWSPPAPRAAPAAAAAPAAFQAPPPAPLPEPPRQPASQPQPQPPRQPGQAFDILTSAWEYLRETLFRRALGNPRVEYARSFGWLQDRRGQAVHPGLNGTSLQLLTLDNNHATTTLPSATQGLICIVHEGSLAVELQGVPGFVIGRGSQWTVGFGQECRVRNLSEETNAILYLSLRWRLGFVEVSLLLALTRSIFDSTGAWKKWRLLLKVRR
ncbi:hypothetical protein B0T20DRAFT_465418 [Sordaria brevicollis]|uniref:Uncharacterized protein n=1 Tax=Sordaria brevicollis TaxID=83679 RepID=A0AAE0UFT8_SORBR|nr:hypothetical protein B0T20DRAFT_465418 [Sordaria brevicollis]